MTFSVQCVVLLADVENFELVLETNRFRMAEVGGTIMILSILQLQERTAGDHEAADGWIRLHVLLHMRPASVHVTLFVSLDLKFVLHFAARAPQSESQ